MDKTFMIECLINMYTDGNKSKFAAKIGVKPQTISAWLARDTFDAELIYAKCENISADWLLSGEGEMTKGDTNAATITNSPGSIAVGGGNNGTTIAAQPVETELLRERVSHLEAMLSEKDKRITLLERLVGQ